MTVAALLLASALTGPAPSPVPTAAQASPSAEQAFFARHATAPGIVALPGLEVEVLASGPPDGAHPKRADEITVRYRGTFPDGRVFNTSPEDGSATTTFPLGKLIPGWQAALPLMRPGDRWRLWLPAYLAYGAAGKSYIPPDSTLVFEVELVSVTPAPSAPAG